MSNALVNRYLPVARQHFVTTLTNTSVVVKAVCAVVCLSYLVSLGVELVEPLSINPGFLIPSTFRVWTLLTHGLLETQILHVAISITAVVVAGKLLEPIWGALELLIFLTLVTIVTGIFSAFFYLFVYMATSDDSYIFEVHIYGLTGFAAGVCVALKQTRPDQVLAPAVDLRVKHIPLLLLVGSILLKVATLTTGTYPVMTGMGILSSWIYLRFYQRHGNQGKGDMGDVFTFATFFPEPVQAPIAILANMVYSGLVKIKVCKKTVKRYDVGAPSSITISLPGTDPADAERRRKKALQALNERLSKVQQPEEEEGDWPAMEEVAPDSVVVDVEGDKKKVPTPHRSPRSSPQVTPARAASPEPANSPANMPNGPTNFNNGGNKSPPGEGPS
ncbi:transmembrane protein 115-like [Branchiostoma floridae x Branchiostoma japonicum]